MLLSELARLIDQTIARTGDGKAMGTYEGIAVPILDLFRTDPECEDLPPPPNRPDYLLDLDDGVVNYRMKFEHPDDRAP